MVCGQDLNLDSGFGLTYRNRPAFEPQTSAQTRNGITTCRSAASGGRNHLEESKPSAARRLQRLLGKRVVAVIRFHVKPGEAPVAHNCDNEQERDNENEPANRAKLKLLRKRIAEDDCE